MNETVRKVALHLPDIAATLESSLGNAAEEHIGFALAVMYPSGEEISFVSNCQPETLKQVLQILLERLPPQTETLQ